jgi:putative SOS response-associated peptidase YedK
MCGRFDNLIARDAYRGLFKAGRLPKWNFPPRYNIAPTDQIPIVRIDPRDGEREVVMARWGLIPFWMKEKPRVPHINARAETVEKLPLFREAFCKRRCLIPATGFYEWQKREDAIASNIAKLPALLGPSTISQTNGTRQKTPRRNRTKHAEVGFVP